MELRLLGRITYDSNVSDSASAWPLISNQHLNAIVFIVALIVVITITPYYFAAVIIIISTVRTSFLPIAQLRSSMLVYGTDFMKRANRTPTRPRQFTFHLLHEHSGGVVLPYSRSLAKIMIGSRLTFK